MIKIEIDDAPELERRYLRNVFSAAMKRLRVFQTSFNHVRNINISADEEYFKSYYAITRKIINAVSAKDIEETKFKNPKLYVSTVTDFVSNPNDLHKINVDGLLRLVKYLIKNKGANLRKLLICPADKLANLNEQLIKKDYKLEAEIDQFMVKLFIHYESFPSVVKKIKKHFRQRNLVFFCPYCNIGEADYSKNKAGEPSTVHHLDHFFDQASHPLLSYSLYNLVPSDTGCNSTINKGTITFSDDYHLNPYSDGFGKTVIFKPELKGVGPEIKEIHLTGIPSSGRRHDQLIGKGKRIDEGSELGNVNVFSLWSKYNRPQVIEQGERIFKKIYNMASTRRSLIAFLEDMRLEHSEENYKKWYFHETGTAFDEKEFGKYGYSKLFRDIHDDVLKKDTNKVNDDIREFSSI